MTSSFRQELNLAIAIVAIDGLQAERVSATGSALRALDLEAHRG